MDAESRARRRAELEAKKEKLFKQRRDKQRRIELQIADRRRKEIEEARRLAEEEGRVFDEDVFTAELIAKEPTLGAVAQRPAKKELTPQQQKMARLQVEGIENTSMFPQDVQVYEKHTQTTQTFAPAEVDKDNTGAVFEARKAAALEKKEEENAMLLEEARKRKKELLTPKHVSAQKVADMVASPEFEGFFTKTSRMVERYFENVPEDGAKKKGGNKSGTIARDDKKKDKKQPKAKDLDAPNALTLEFSYTEPKWIQGRGVVDVAWSSEYPELFLAAYDAGPEMRPDSEHTGALEPPGLVIVWSRHMHSRPEFVCTCESPVVCARFAPWHPSLIIGACYSGQIVVWDTRSKKHTPIRSTPPSPECHTAPVYTMKMLGTKNAHTLLTLSTDGKMCQWMLDDFSHPQTVITFVKGKNLPLAANAMSFPAKEVNTFVCGTEEGEVFVAKRLGNDAGIKETLEGHHGLVTSVHSHPLNGSIDFSYLTLTSSIDWSCKIWARETHAPLFEARESRNYVFDAQWSPTHPALFASCDGEGIVDLWNLNKRLECPISRTDVSAAPLHTLRWSADGRRIVTGDADGVVHLYLVEQKVADAGQSDWIDFQKIIGHLRADLGEQPASGQSKHGV